MTVFQFHQTQYNGYILNLKSQYELFAGNLIKNLTCQFLTKTFVSSVKSLILCLFKSHICTHLPGKLKCITVLSGTTLSPSKLLSWLWIIFDSTYKNLPSDLRYFDKSEELSHFILISFFKLEPS